MTMKPIAPFFLCASALFISLLSACETPKPRTTITKIDRMSASDMVQLSHVGNVWISEQPTQKDLEWMRDNYVSLVIDTRTRDEDRGFDERAYVVFLGMKYRLESLDPKQEFTIRYFDRMRAMLSSRRDVPTLIHGASADRAAGAWLPYRVLDERVPYSQAVAEARIAGLERDETLRIVQQYLVSRGVDINEKVNIEVTAEEAPDETIFHVFEEDEAKKKDDVRE